MTNFVICEHSTSRIVCTCCDEYQAKSIVDDLNNHCASDRYKAIVFDDNRNTKQLKKEFNNLNKNIYWRVKIDRSGVVVNINASDTYVKLNVIEEDAWQNYYVYLCADDRTSAIKEAQHRVQLKNQEKYEQ